jgi:hypothetical protein
MKIYLKNRFWSKVNFKGNKGCWEWTASLDGKGYGQISINGKTKRAHHIAWELTVGKIPKGKFICHHCDNKKCVNPNHLFLGTPLSNIQDMDKKGRRINSPLCGEKHGRSKLKNLDVQEIKNLMKIGIKQRKIAEMFNIGVGTINHIAKGRQWKSI